MGNSSEGVQSTLDLEMREVFGAVRRLIVPVLNKVEPEPYINDRWKQAETADRLLVTTKSTYTTSFQKNVYLYQKAYL